MMKMQSIFFFVFSVYAEGDMNLNSIVCCVTKCFCDQGIPIRTHPGMVVTFSLNMIQCTLNHLTDGLAVASHAPLKTNA